MPSLKTKIQHQRLDEKSDQNFYWYLKEHGTHSAASGSSRHDEPAVAAALATGVTGLQLRPHSNDSLGFLMACRPC